MRRCCIRRTLLQRERLRIPGPRAHGSEGCWSCGTGEWVSSVEGGGGSGGMGSGLSLLGGGIRRKGLTLVRSARCLPQRLQIAWRRWNGGRAGEAVVAMWQCSSGIVGSNDADSFARSPVRQFRYCARPCVR